MVYVPHGDVCASGTCWQQQQQCWSGIGSHLCNGQLIEEKHNQVVENRFYVMYGVTQAGLSMFIG
jgi:hypothetical protein